MNQLLDVSDVNNVNFTGVSFIDDIVGLGEKKIALDIKHFNDLNLESDKVDLVINRESLAKFMDGRNEILLEYENYPEFDHMNSMIVMLEYDFNSIDRIKLFYKDENNLSGEYVIDTSDEDIVAMKSETHDGELILNLGIKS
ncbi:hypothetical protein [Salinicoccus sp. Marseille-QA3877]